MSDNSHLVGARSRKGSQIRSECGGGREVNVPRCVTRGL